MKQELKRKLLPCGYKDDMYDQLTNLRQRHDHNWICKQDLRAKIQCKGVEVPFQALSQSKPRLKAEIHNQMVPHHLFDVDKAFQLVLKMNKNLKQPLTRRISSPTKKIASTKHEENERTKTFTMQGDFNANNAADSNNRIHVDDD